MRILILDDHKCFIDMVKTMIEHIKAGTQILEEDDGYGFDIIFADMNRLPIVTDAVVISMSSTDINADLVKPFGFADMKRVLGWLEI